MLHLCEFLELAMPAPGAELVAVFQYRKHGNASVSDDACLT